MSTFNFFFFVSKLWLLFLLFFFQRCYLFHSSQLEAEALSRGVMRSAGRLVEPVVFAVHGKGPASLLGRLVRWSAEKSGASATAHAIGGLSARSGRPEAFVPGFSRANFLTAAGADVRAVVDALSSPGGAPAALARLAPMLSETMQGRLARGAAESRAAAGGAQQCAEVVREEAPPELLQARFAYPPSNPSAGIAAALSPRPTHAQLTVRVRLLLRPYALVQSSLPTAATARGRSSHAAAVVSPPSAGSQAAASRARAQQGDWRPVLDASSGLIYWSAPGGAAGAADRSSWTPPSPAATLPQAPFRLELAGAEREPLQAEAGAAPLIRVAFVAVFERAIAPAAAVAAAAARSAATERWRLVDLV